MGPRAVEARGYDRDGMKRNVKVFVVVVVAQENAKDAFVGTRNLQTKGWVANTARTIFHEHFPWDWAILVQVLLPHNDLTRPFCTYAAVAAVAGGGAVDANFVGWAVEATSIAPPPCPRKKPPQPPRLPTDPPHPHRYCRPRFSASFSVSYPDDAP